MYFHRPQRNTDVAICNHFADGLFNSYSASHDSWRTATLWNRIMTAQCEGMGEVGSARYEPALLPACPSIRALSYSNCQRSTHSNIRAWQFKCLLVTWHLICWFAKVEYGHTWHQMSLLTSGFIIQHDLSIITIWKILISACTTITVLIISILFFTLFSWSKRMEASRSLLPLSPIPHLRRKRIARKEPKTKARTRGHQGLARRAKGTMVSRNLSHLSDWLFF